MKWVFLEKINLIVFSTHPNELFSVAFIWKNLFWREVEHKIAFYWLNKHFNRWNDAKYNSLNRRTIYIYILLLHFFIHMCVCAPRFSFFSLCALILQVNEIWNDLSMLKAFWHLAFEEWNHLLFTCTSGYPLIVSTN